MYRKEADGWMKHLDFIVLDMVCLQIAFILAYLLRLGKAGLLSGGCIPPYCRRH